MNSNNIVEIFKTNIMDQKAAKFLVSYLAAKFPHMKFNVDLHDTDKVLRMEGPTGLKQDVMTITQILGFECIELN